MKRFTVLAIKGYQRCISPFLPDSCRFYPSCSSYCVEAVEHHGILKGIWLFLKRILKCHPFHPGGFDPVKSSKEAVDYRD